MQAQVIVSIEDEIREFPFEFEVLPRAGERVILRSGLDLYSGLVDNVEHHGHVEGKPASLSIFVIAD